MVYHLIQKAYGNFRYQTRTQAATTRGFGLEEFRKVGNLITKTIKGLSENPDDNSKIEKKYKKKLIELCSKFDL